MVSKKSTKSKKKRYCTNSAEKKKRLLTGKQAPPLSSFPQNLLQEAFTLQQAGRFVEAAALCEQALMLQPNNPELLYSVSVLSYQSGKNEKALNLINKALAYKPDYVKAYEAKIDILLALGKMDDAVTASRHLLTSRPEDFKTNNDFGLLLHRAGRIEESITYYRRALSIQPESAIAHRNIANAFRELGHFSESITHYRKTLSLQPDFVEAFRALSSMEKHTKINDDILFYEDMFIHGNIDDNKRINLGFALGKIFEDLNDYEKAFSFLFEANRLKRMSYKYSVQTDHELFERIKATFSKDFFTSHSDTGDKDRTPIFILGMPRSGSTLVEQILASHSQVIAAGEIATIPYLIYKNSFGLKTKQIPECFAGADKGIFDRMGSDYIKSIRTKFGNSKYIIDKNLFNFLNVGLIKAILPNAKVIHTLRNPMDNCLSIYKNFFINNKTCKFAYHLTELGQYYNLYSGLMKHWEETLPGFMYTLRYEELVSSPESQISSLFEFCELTTVEDGLSFYESKRAVQTNSFMQVRKPIYKNSVELWRKYEKQLEPLRKALDQVR